MRTTALHVTPHAAVTATQIQTGDRAAFARLFEENRGRLLALAYRMTSSSAEAEDVVQDAFVSSLRHHRQFQGNAQPSTWLYRVTVNAALMRLRTRRRKGAARLDDLPPHEAERSLAAVSPANPDPWDALLARLEQRSLDAAMATLKPLDRQLVRLRFREGLRVEEVADAVGLPVTTVKSRIHRARLALKDELAQDARPEQR